MSENKNNDRTNAKVGRTWSPKNEEHNTSSLPENFILGMTDQHIALNSE